MRPLKDLGILVQVLLVNASERTQEVTKSRPSAFTSIRVDFSETVPVFISRPLSAAGGVVDRLVKAPGLREPTVRLQLIRIHDRIRASVPLNERLKTLSICVFHDLKMDMSALPTEDPGNRRTVVVKRTPSAPLIGASSRRIKGIRVLLSFLSGVLEQLVGFRHAIRQDERRRIGR